MKPIDATDPSGNPPACYQCDGRRLAINGEPCRRCDGTGVEPGEIDGERRRIDGTVSSLRLLGGPPGGEGPAATVRLDPDEAMMAGSFGPVGAAPPSSSSSPPVPAIYEQVDHPPHYGGESNPFEAIKIIEALDLGFHAGNCLKYLVRAGRKPGTVALTDYRKARWYLDRLIARLEETR